MNIHNVTIYKKYVASFFNIAAADAVVVVVAVIFVSVDDYSIYDDDYDYNR